MLTKFHWLMISFLVKPYTDILNILSHKETCGFLIEYLYKSIYHAQVSMLFGIFELEISSTNDLVKAQVHNK